MILESLSAELVEAVLKLSNSQSAERSRVERALVDAHKKDDGWPWILEMWADKVVYHRHGKSYERSYSVSGESVTLGDPTEMQMAYIPASEALVEASVESELVELTEGARADGLVPIKLIGPGQGTMAYYTKESLKQAAADKVFAKGTQMYWNHATAEEIRARPEGNLDHLAAELASDAEWKESGVYGPGLYALAKPARKHYAEAIDELAKNTGFGVSIRASGQGRPGKVAGKSTVILERFDKARSVDFVTRAGAGGKVVELFEAAGRCPVDIQEGETKVAKIEIEESELKTLRESAGKVTLLESAMAELRADSARASAVAHITTKVNGIKDLQEATRAHLITALTPRVVITKENAVDTAACDALVESAVKEHRAYLATLGVGSTARVNALGNPVDAQESKAGATVVNVAESIGKKAKAFLGMEVK